MSTATVRRIVPAIILGIALLAAPRPAVAAPPQPCNDALLVSETVAKDTIMAPGQAFVKTWRVQNSGTCNWTDKYALVRDSGPEVGGPAWQALAYSVWPGWSTDLSVQLTAPWTPGIYASTWHLVDDNGWRFGPDLTVQIAVPNPALGTTVPDTISYQAGAVVNEVACDWPPPRADKPVLKVAGSGRAVKICAYGFPARSVVTAHLLQPDGGGYSAPYYVGDAVKASDRWGEFETTVLEIRLRWPDNVPNGYWRFSLYTDRIRLQEDLLIQSDVPASHELRILPPGWVQVFDTVVAPRALGWTHSYPAGEVVSFVGYGYLPNSSVELGIYRGDDSTFARADQLTARTDAAGAFQKAYRIPASFGAGPYWVVAWQATGVKTPAQPKLLGSLGTLPFYVRAAVDSPLLSLYARGDPKTAEVEVSAINLGKTSTQGGTITVSSPDVSEMKIVEADVPIKDAVDCTISAPVARLLGPGTRCNWAVQYNTDCRNTFISYPMAEGRYSPWSTGKQHRLRIAFAPLKGVRQVRFYVRAAAMAGPSGCRMEIAPRAGEAIAIDQQGFPAQVVFVPAGQ